MPATLTPIGSDDEILEILRTVHRHVRLPAEVRRTDHLALWPNRHRHCLPLNSLLFLLCTVERHIAKAASRQETVFEPIPMTSLGRDKYGIIVGMLRSDPVLSTWTLIFNDCILEIAHLSTSPGFQRL